MDADTQAVVRKNRMFADVPDAVIEAVIPRLQPMEVDEDEVIFQEGSAAGDLFLIERGAVRITRSDGTGHHVILSYLGEGDAFGEMGLFGGGVRSASATAAQPTHLLRLELPAFEAALRVAPIQLLSNVLRLVVERLHAADEQRMEQNLRAERLSVIGAMTGAIMHDLKNPLNVIQGAAGLLEEGSVQDPQMLAGMLRRASTRMQGMIEELLEYSRGTSRLRMGPVPVREVILDVEEQGLQALELSGIQVERRLQFDGYVTADRDALARAILNVIRNAGEVLNRRGVLRITIEESGEDVVFTITDTGPGIPSDILPRIFEPFVTHGKRSGTGLGLATTRSIIDAHHGRIHVSSTVGEGTTFEISVPRADSE